MDETAQAQETLTIMNRLLSQLPAFVYRRRLDERQTALFLGEGCPTVTGYPVQDLVDNRQMTFAELIHPDDRAGSAATMREAAAAGRPYRVTYRLLTAGGEMRWVLDQGAAEGDRAIVAGFVTDHTEQIAAFQALEHRVIDRTRRLEALYDILQATTDNSDLPTTIHRILARVLRAVRASVGTIHLFTRRRDALQLVACQGLIPDAVAHLEQLATADEPLVAALLAETGPIRIPDRTRDSRTAAWELPGAPPGLIGIPIQVGDQTIGLLTLYHQRAERLARRDSMALLQSVGEQIGVVVENARLRQQAAQVMVMEERNRLARELHDSVTQSLYSVTLFAEAGRRMAADGNFEQATQYLAQVGESGRQALKEMRLLVHKLRPSLLTEEGLVRAIQRRLNAVEGRAGINSRLMVEGDVALPPVLEEAVYHLTQEALNNALKHAMASEVQVTLAADNEGGITLSVRDDGQGFDPAQASEAGGLGLTSMRERVDMLGGTLAVDSAPGQGTTIQVRLRQDAGARRDARQDEW